MTQPIDNPGTPAADHAHLCNHTPDASDDTQGCPRWPSCLAPDAEVDRAKAIFRALSPPPPLTEAQMADFERRFREAMRAQVARVFDAPGAPMSITPYRAPRGPLRRLRRWWHR